MPTINPFADDSVKAAVFEEGFIDGFMEPDASGFRPFASDSCSSAKQTRCVVLAALSPPGQVRSGLTPDQSMPPELTGAAVRRRQTIGNLRGC
jgi:hypothetical protein